MKAPDDKRRNDMIIAGLILVICAALGYVLFLKDALSASADPSANPNLAVEQISVKADPQTIKAAKSASSGAPLEQLVEEAVSGSVQLSEVQEKKDVVSVQGTGEMEDIAAFVAKLAGDLEFAGGGQIRGSGPLVVISDFSATATGPSVQFSFDASQPGA